MRQFSRAYLPLTSLLSEPQKTAGGNIGNLQHTDFQQKGRSLRCSCTDPKRKSSCK